MGVIISVMYSSYHGYSIMINLCVGCGFVNLEI